MKATSASSCRTWKSHAGRAWAGKLSGGKERLATKRFERDLVRGWLHEPVAAASGRGLVITHGAGSNCESLLLRAVAEIFSEAGYHVLLCDLPYRQQRASGPPLPGAAVRD